MHRTTPKLTTLSALGGVLLWGAAAMAAPINTDRPTAGESSGTVGWTTVQVEIGPDVTMDEEAGASTRSIRTPIELRYGITENSEIHLQSAGFASESVSQVDFQIARFSSFQAALVRCPEDRLAAVAGAQPGFAEFRPRWGARSKGFYTGRVDGRDRDHRTFGRSRHDERS